MAYGDKAGMRLRRECNEIPRTLGVRLINGTPDGPESLPQLNLRLVAVILARQACPALTRILDPFFGPVIQVAMLIPDHPFHRQSEA